MITERWTAAGREKNFSIRHRWQLFSSLDGADRRRHVNGFLISPDHPGQKALMHSR